LPHKGLFAAPRIREVLCLPLHRVPAGILDTPTLPAFSIDRKSVASPANFSVSVSAASG
jgi:hypothetical protein